MRTPWRILMTRLWWRRTWEESGNKSHRDFLKRFDAFRSERAEFGIDRRQLSAWERGEQYVQKGTVGRVACRVRGTKHIYVLGELLSTRYITECSVRLLMADPFMVDCPKSLNSNPPVDQRSLDGNPLPKLNSWEDSAELVKRGDFFSLLGLLALVRIASAKPVRGDNWELHVKNLYRVLPAVICIPWIRPDADLLLECIERLLQVLRPFGPVVRIDWDLFRAQVVFLANESGSSFHAGDLVFGEARDGAVDFFLGSEKDLKPRPFPLLPDVKPLALCKQPPSQNDRTVRVRRRLGLGDLLELLIKPPAHE